MVSSIHDPHPLKNPSDNHYLPSVTFILLIIIFISINYYATIKPLIHNFSSRISKS